MLTVFQAGALANAKLGFNVDDVPESDVGIIYSVSGPGM
jgi:hypothetical protein